MKVALSAVAFCALFAGTAAVQSRAAEENPLAAVIKLLKDLSAKVVAEGEEESKAFKEYAEWCKETTTNLKFDITTATTAKEKLEAHIVEASADIEACSAKIEELAGSISASTSEQKNATEIRKAEAAEFAASDKELVEVVDTLDRAITILSKEMQKNMTGFTQIDKSNMASLMQSLSVVVDAAAFSGSDKQKLLALVQSQQGSDDTELGAPEPDAYASHSSSIIDVLEDLKDKAEVELSDLRKAEVNSKHNFEMLKQSLEDQIAADTKDLDAEKSSKAATEESKAAAEGDLNTTTAELTTSEEALASTTTTCEQVAADSEATVAARTEELKVIAEGIEVLESSTTGGVEQTYSLLQLRSRAGSMLRSRADLANSEVVNLVKKLARQHHSAALAQLASRILAVVKYGSTAGEDPFAKVKGLIQELIERLQAEASAEATEKAFCDEEMATTEQKKGELTESISKLTTKLDQAAARSSQLKEEVTVLQGELSALLKSQAEMDSMRGETHADYVKAKAELEQGLTGVRKALTVLRDYYSKKEETALMQSGVNLGAFMQQPALPKKHKAATGSATSIIGILEVVESDFAGNLAKEETQEADAQEAYEKMTQENKIVQATKEQDVKYKTKEFGELDATIAELTSDRQSQETELSAVDEYFASLKERCIAKPETYESRKERRAAEIAGLKEALSVLEGEAAFMQRKQRGVHKALLARK
mmetsp:Transcript_50111/g.108875  ORF Transcript_50111/g.108875 Transcript_50111/m.108875 type:complete len:712 (+) Transcript_50111:74-2209(+)